MGISSRQPGRTWRVTLASLLAHYPSKTGCRKRKKTRKSELDRRDRRCTYLGEALVIAWGKKKKVKRREGNSGKSAYRTSRLCLDREKSHLGVSLGYLGGSHAALVLQPP